MIGIGIVGYGYWGPNLARNFSSLPDCRLAAICDGKPAQAARARSAFGGAAVTESYRELLDNPDVQAVAIATPVSTHFSLAEQALNAGKHVLLEKPFTETSEEAQKLIDLAESRKRVLMVDHTFIYTPEVKKMKELIAAGELGDIAYIDSVRVNLGLFQQDVNVIHDLAPHDLSIACHLLGRAPVSVQAVGACREESDMEYIAYIHLEFEGDAIAHFHLNWLSPVKVRRTLIAGSKKMIVYDDMEVGEKVKVYDKSVDMRKIDAESKYQLMIDYRTGDMVAPKIEHREALRTEAEHFLACIRDGAEPITDARSGLEVVRIIEAAQRSIKNRGARVELT